MGTRRSKHNRGRKPFYKNIERTTLADIAPVEVERWEDEADAFFEGHRLDNFYEARAATGSYVASKIPQQDVELTEQVKAYLAKRQEEAKRKDAASVFPEVRRLPERVALPSFFKPEIEQVSASARDVLMQLFVERKISAGQLHAGRRWQADKERATIQPSRSIDWSKSLAGYQRRGDLTESQYAAMVRRRAFVGFAGFASATFLDFCLEPDRGRDTLIEIMRLPAAQVEASINDLLVKLCECYGDSWREKRRQYCFRVQ